MLESLTVSAKYLHIVSFNIPYPPDYGGIIDIFFKIKALKNAGIMIILHCFEYGRQPAKELEDLCYKVYYYSRRSGLKYFLTTQPYIVTTRESKTMPDNLLRDPFPVLFEGLHTTSLLKQCYEAKKLTMVRAHNIEHLYYRALSASEKQPFRKLFFRSESHKLRRYEHILTKATYVLGIAIHETEYFEHIYGNAVNIPAFHRFDNVISLPGTGDYLLFHGNLGVPENSEAFLKLAAGVFQKRPYRVIVAGKNPSNRFRRKLTAYKHIELKADPSDEELRELLQNAQVNLLQTEQSTGIKLKLLHALFAGRHCLVNNSMVKGTSLEPLCTVTGHISEIPDKLDTLMNKPFSLAMIGERKKALQDYTNRANAEKILRLIN